MAGTLLVFIIFLILLLKVNRSVNTADLEPADKPVFWVMVTLSSKAQVYGIQNAIISPQIMAIIVTVLGLIFTLPFQIFIREKPSVALKKLKWYKWLINPKFYLVSTDRDRVWGMYGTSPFSLYSYI